MKDRSSAISGRGGGPMAEALTRLGYLAGVVALLPLLADGVLPLTPLVAAAAGSHAPMLHVVTAFFVGMACGQLLLAAGGRDERARAAMIGAMALAISGCVAMALARDPLALTAGRFAQGVAVGAGIAIARALAFSLKREGGAAAASLGWLNVVAALTATAAPILNGVLADASDWRLALLVPAALAVIVAIAWPIEPQEPAPSAAPPAEARRFGIGLVLSAATFGALYSWLGALTQALAVDAGRGVAEVGLGQAVSTAGFVLGSIAVAARAVAYGRRAFLLAATTSALAAAAASAAPAPAVLLLAPAVMAGIGVMLSYSVAFVVAARPGRTTASAASAGAAQSAAGALAGLVLSAAPGALWLAASALALCVGAALLTRRGDWA